MLYAKKGNINSDYHWIVHHKDPKLLKMLIVLLNELFPTFTTP